MHPGSTSWGASFSTRTMATLVHWICRSNKECFAVEMAVQFHRNELMAYVQVRFGTDCNHRQSRIKWLEPFEIRLSL
jgi:hypothetical protein